MRKLLVASGFALPLVLSGCGSTPKTTTTAPVKSNPVQPVKSDEPDLTPEILLTRAQQHWAKNQDLQQRNTLLLQAAHMYITQQAPLKAQQILLSLKDSISQNNLAWYQLLQAQVYQDSASPEKLLSLVTMPSSDESITREQALIAAKQYAKLGQWLAAANALLTYNEDSEETVTQAWQWITRAYLENEQLSATQGRKFTKLQAYLVLNDLIKENGLNSQQLAQAITQYRAVYRGHPLTNYWPTSVTNALQLPVNNADNLVVMLPLSGRLGATGMVVKDGILSAYYRSIAEQGSASAPTISFVDTVDQPVEVLLQAAENADWVIGPLLKETVQAISGKLPVTTKLLALNRLDESPIAPLNDTLPASQTREAFFALAPEDEAVQLAEHIYRQGYRAPVIVSAQSSVTQRMKEAFDAEWHILTQYSNNGVSLKLTHVDFSDTKSLKDGITAALDVAQSNDRIDEIESLSNERVYEQPRNRRDIDAIVVFANPEQTELLNPMIEASLSPVGREPTPVYATSRSVEYNSSRNQWRDLQNLRFIDIPWLVSAYTDSTAPNTEWQNLASESRTLWPNRSTQMQRFFAFGVDAYNLLPHVANLSTLPQLKISGLTGKLSINENGEIIRTLPRAIIDNETVKQASE